MDIKTQEGLIEAYVFERRLDQGLDAVKSAFSRAPGVEFVGQFVGGFSLFGRVVAEDLATLQRRIRGEYWEAGIHSDWSLNLTGSRAVAPKRGSPPICAMVLVQATEYPFTVLWRLDEVFEKEGGYGAAVITGRDADLLVDLGADTVEDVLDRVTRLHEVRGVGRTSTALADLSDGAFRAG